MENRTEWRTINNSKIIGVNIQLSNKVVARIAYIALRCSDDPIAKLIDYRIPEQNNCVFDPRLSMCKKSNFEQLCKDERLKHVRDFYYHPLKGIVNDYPQFKEKCINTHVYTISQLADKRGNYSYILVY